MKEEILRNIIQEELISALKEQDMDTGVFSPAEEKFLAKFAELGATSLGILYTKNEVGIREFLMRSGKDYNLTPDVLSKLMKDGIISIVPYGGYARNQDYTLQCNLPLDELEGLSSGTDKESDDGAGDTADVADAPEPTGADDVANIDSPQESAESSMDLSKLLVTEQKKSLRHTKSRVHTGKSRALRRLPKGYIIYLEKIIQILGQKLHTDLEKQHLVADILDNLAHNFGLTPKQVYKSFIFYNSQNRLKNVVRESLNEQVVTKCTGNNPIQPLFTKIDKPEYQKTGKQEDYWTANMFFKVYFNATKTAESQYPAIIKKFVEETYANAPDEAKYNEFGKLRPLEIYSASNVYAAASNHYQDTALEPTKLKSTQPVDYGNGKKDSPLWKKNYQFAQGRAMAFEKWLKSNVNKYPNLELVSKLDKLKNPQVTIIDTGGCNDETRDIAKFPVAGQYFACSLYARFKKYIKPEFGGDEDLTTTVVNECGQGLKVLVGYFAENGNVDNIDIPANSGNHQCDQATFDIDIDGVKLGTCNLNNGRSNAFNQAGQEKYGARGMGGTFKSSPEDVSFDPAVADTFGIWDGLNPAESLSGNGGAINIGVDQPGRVAPTRAGGSVYVVFEITPNILQQIIQKSNSTVLQLFMSPTKGAMSKRGSSNGQHGDAPKIMIWRDSSEDPNKKEILFGPAEPEAGNMVVSRQFIKGTRTQICLPKNLNRIKKKTLANV